MLCVNIWIIKRVCTYTCRYTVITLAYEQIFQCKSAMHVPRCLYQNYIHSQLTYTQNVIDNAIYNLKIIAGKNNSRSEFYKFIYTNILCNDGNKVSTE